MRKGHGFVAVDRGEVGAAIAGLQEQLDVLTQGGEDSTAAVVTLPEPASPFAVYFRPHEKKIHKGCFGLFRTLIPSSGGDRLRTVIQPTNPISLTGTGAIAGTTTLTGTSTIFNTEISKGDQIIVNAQTRIVDNVASDTSLTVTVAFSGTSSGHAITAVRKRDKADATVDVTEDDRVKGQIEYEFPEILEWNVPYGLRRLIYWEDDGGKRLKNPVDEPDIGTYLTTFSTPTNNPGTLTSLSLTITQDDSRRASVDLNLTQPSVPVAIESVRLRRKLQGAADGTYVIIVRKFSMWTDDFFSTGAHTIEIADTVKTKPAKSYTWECRIKAIGGTTTTFTQDSTGTDTFDEPAKANQKTHKNLIEGGSFLYSSADFGGANATDAGKNWRVAVGTGTRINSLATGVGGNTLDSHGVQWDPTNHRLKLTTSFQTLGGQITAKLHKQVIPGTVWNLVFAIKAATGYTEDITCQLYDNTNAAPIDGCDVTVDDYVITTEYSLVYVRFEVDTAYVMSGSSQWLRMFFVTDPNFETYIDNVDLKRGDSPSAFEPGEEEATLDIDTINVGDTGIGELGGRSGTFYGGDGEELGGTGGGQFGGIIFL